MGALNSNGAFTVLKENANVAVKKGDGKVVQTVKPATVVDKKEYEGKYVAADAARKTVLYVYNGMTWAPGNGVSLKAFSGKEIKDLNISLTNPVVTTWKRGGDLGQLRNLMTAAKTKKSSAVTNSATSGGGFNGVGANDLEPVILPPASKPKRPILVFFIALASFVVGGIALFKKKLIR